MCLRLQPTVVGRRSDPGAPLRGSDIDACSEAPLITAAARRCLCVIVVLVIHAILTVSISAADPALDGAFQTLVTLKQGQDLGVFAPIERAITHAHSDAKVRTDLELRFISVLRGDATDLAKQYACRQLTLVGTDASLPALAQLLTNARLAHMARYAMEGIGGVTARQLLRAALPKTSGREKLGVVISLGRLADTDAVQPIAELLGGEDPEIREVAVVALGRIGTAPAAQALTAFSAQAPDALRSVVVDARLEAAESLCQRRDYPAAAAVYQSLQAARSGRVRAAAFRGLIAAKPAESLAVIVSGLSSEQPWKRAVAADCVLTLKEPAAIERIAAAVATLPNAGKIAALASLKNRCHPAVRAAALESVRQGDVQLRTIALQALTTSGTAADVTTIADVAIAATDPTVRDAAFKTLCLMTAAETNQAIISLITADKDPSPILVRCALERRSPAFIPAFLHAAHASNQATRLEAFKALAIMATAKDVDTLVALLCGTAPGAEREAAGRAVWMACQKVAEPAGRAAPLLRAFQKTDASGQCAILPSLARLGGAESLVAVHAAMRSKDSAVRDAGYRALANWPDATVADELFDIAKTSKVASYRVWALRAFARVVSLPGAFPPAQAFQKLESALQMAARTEDRQLIVTRLGAVRTPASLELLLSLLDDPALKNTVVPAVFSVAKGLSQTDPERAAAALEKIRPLTNDPATIQQIPKVLRDIKARKKKPLTDQKK